MTDREYELEKKRLDLEIKKFETEKKNGNRVINSIVALLAVIITAGQLLLAYVNHSDSLERMDKQLQLDKDLKFSELVLKEDKLDSVVRLKLQMSFGPDYVMKKITGYEAVWTRKFTENQEEPIKVGESEGKMVGKQEQEVPLTTLIDVVYEKIDTVDNEPAKVGNLDDTTNIELSRDSTTLQVFEEVVFTNSWVKPNDLRGKIYFLSVKDSVMIWPIELFEKSAKILVNTTKSGREKTEISKEITMKIGETLEIERNSVKYLVTLNDITSAGFWGTKAAFFRAVMRYPVKHNDL